MIIEKINNIYTIPINLILFFHEKFYKLINFIFTFIIINLWKYKFFQFITPNGVTYIKTCLAIPCCYMINYRYYQTASIFVLINDLLYFFDGSLARALKKNFNIKFDGCYGSYIDAICDKIFSIIVWSFIIINKLYFINISNNNILITKYFNILSLLLLICIESFSFFERTKMYLLYPNKTQLASNIGKTKQTFQMLYTFFLILNLFETKYEYLIYIPTIHFSLYSLYNKIKKIINN